MNFYVDEKTANNLINITDHTIEGTMKVGESMTKNQTIYILSIIVALGAFKAFLHKSNIKSDFKGKKIIIFH